MQSTAKVSGARRLLAGARTFFTGAGLPVFLLALALVYEAFLLAVLFAPPGSGPWSGFAQEFKVWCFRYDPATGGMEWAAVWIMLLEPLFILGMVLLLWRSALPGLLRRGAWRVHGRPAIAGSAAALLALGGIVAYGLPARTPEAPQPFPGERIRTRLEPAPFSLTDHKGAPLSLRELRGRVVLLTGVYAHCSVACPSILREIGAVLDGLPEPARAWLSVVALSLNPEYDEPELMDRVATGYGFAYPEFRYLNGDPDTVRALTARYQFGAVRDAATGVVDHANLFILIDAEGRIAYRFNLDPRHSAWLQEAIVALADEARAAQ
jgi:protein SCO1/2